MFVQREGRILSILGVCSCLAAYCYLISYYVWAEPQLVMLLSKIMGGGLSCHDLRRSTNNFLADLFWMLIRVDVFSLRKPAGNSTCPVFNLRVPPRVGANRPVCITAFWCLRWLKHLFDTFYFWERWRQRIGILCGFVAVATEWLIASLFVEYFEWIGLYVWRQKSEQGGY